MMRQPIIFRCLIVLALLPFLLVQEEVYSQAPNSFNYQAALRNNSGGLLADETIAVRVSILDSTATGSIRYQEVHSLTTTAQGLIHLKIGSGTLTEGAWEDIRWDLAPIFLQVEVGTGEGYLTLGTQQLVSVPYALHAQNTEAIAGRKVALTAPATGKVLKWNGTVWAPATDANSTAPSGTAGGDLAGNYPNPTIGNSKVTTAKISNAAVTAAKLASNAVTTVKIANGAVTAAKLNPMGATNGKVLKYNGSTWVPATDNVGTNHWLLQGDTLKRNAGTRLNLGWTNATATGLNATAFGFATMASGLRSTAMGHLSKATGDFSLATGRETTASGDDATAMGYNNDATGDRSFACGYFTLASGENATAIGYLNTASGNNSFAMGMESIASGSRSLAAGLNVTASGNGSVVIGRSATTNNKSGSIIITDGEYLNPHTSSTLNNQLTMRFEGGYRLFTEPYGSTGVTLPANGGSWASISDSSKKENFHYANGEAILNKIAVMKLGSWNYKGQEKERYRHYGPMAQEFYTHFGSDGIGTIGNDTTIATADIDGVMMIAIQALIRENKALKEENTVLKNADSSMIKNYETVLSQLNKLVSENQVLVKRMVSIEKSTKASAIKNVEETEKDLIAGKEE